MGMAARRDSLELIARGIAFALAAEIFQVGADSAKKLAIKTAIDIEQQLSDLTTKSGD